MKLRKLLPSCFLALGLSLSLAACDDGDDGDTSDSNAENADTTGNEEATDEGGVDTDCATFCTNFVDMCIQTGESTEFETYDQCESACADWDQAGINCRNDQIIDAACDQAGNMGSAC